MKETVVVTGASGYIAKHIVVQLLNAGYRVRASVRTPGRGQEVRDVAGKFAPDAMRDPGRLEIAILDLLQDSGWSEALRGSKALVHTASPFPLVQPRNEDDVIGPAVEGTLRALRASRANGIGRVVLTSSVIAILYAPKPAGRSVLDERDWTDLKSPRATAYAKSKTLAERAAWDFVAREAPDIALTAINPALVLGAPLDRHAGTSLNVLQRLLRAKDPAQPNFGFPVVDVEDVARMHVRALERPQTAGKRYIGGDEFVWFPQMAQIVKDAMPERRIVTRRAPDFLIRMLSLFDKEARTILASLGIRDEVSAQRAREDLGIAFKPAAESVRATARFLVENAMV